MLGNQLTTKQTLKTLLSVVNYRLKYEQLLSVLRAILIVQIRDLVREVLLAQKPLL